MKSFQLLKKPKNNIIIEFSNNNLEIYSFKENQETSYYEKEQTISFEKLAHRTPARAIGISDNDQLVITGSGEGVKVWDVETLQPIKTFESGKYVTCVQFLPKNR